VSGDLAVQHGSADVTQTAVIPAGHAGITAMELASVRTEALARSPVEAWT